MTESLAHKELKKKAIEQLKHRGFSADQINEEQWVNFEWEGKKRRYRVDVLGDNGEKKVIFQVGNHSAFQIDLLKKYFETIYISYPAFNPYPKIKEDKETLQEKKEDLFRTYNKIAEHFKNDEVFDFIEYNNKTSDTFKIGKDGAWLLIPTAETATRHELMNNVNMMLSYRGDDTYEVAINTETNSAVKLFLEIIPEDKEKYVKAVNLLPSGYFIQDGYKYLPKGMHHAKRWPRNWDDVPPYDAKKFSTEDLKDIEMRLEFWLELKEKKSPVFRILAIPVKKEELLRVFQQMRPIYKILKTMKSFTKSIIEKLKSLSKWEWHIHENEYEDLYELYCDKYPDDKIAYLEFKKVARSLKKDEEYLKYAKED